jgi:hypothetical protein
VIIIKAQLLTAMEERKSVPNARFFRNLMTNVVQFNDRKEKKDAPKVESLSSNGKSFCLKS